MSKLAPKILRVATTAFLICGFDSVLAQDVVPTRVRLAAFSVAPPPSPRWHSQFKPGHAILARFLNIVPHTFALEAREYPPAPAPVTSPSEMLAGVRNAAQKETTLKGRTVLISHTEKITNRINLDCVEYQKSWIDHGDKNPGFNDLKMIAHGFVCVHPESKDRLIEVSYSARNATGTITKDVEAEGELFISSLRAETLEHANAK